MSLLPNFLDNFAGANFSYGGVQFVKHRHVRRYRHPLVHSPYTVCYFLPLIFLRDKVSNPFLDILVFSLLLSWTSHIFLDSLNPEGIPVGRKPIYSNHLSKHYKWDLLEDVHSFRMARIPFNSLKANKTLSRLGLFFLTMNLANMVINYSQELLEVIS
ncbi:MAG: hypothetical protein ACW97X_07435 [Candidatus Hodarchaeales archaeon]|jgi:hypothetical protein